jgi:hypothetical protein
MIFAVGFFKGSSADQDRRFSDKELKLLKTFKFPPQLDTKVHISLFFVPSHSLHTPAFFFLGRHAQSKLAGHQTLGHKKKS